MILQHLSYDPDFRVVVLYGDHSAKEKTELKQALWNPQSRMEDSSP